MTASTASAEGIRIGRILQAATDTIKSNLVAFLIVGGVCAGVPTALIAAGGGSQTLATGPSGLVALGGLAYLVGVFVMQAGIVHGAVAGMNGGKPTAAELFRTGLPLAFPVFLVGLVVGLGVILATLLLIVPGIILYCAWAVAVPARVVEGGGVGAALSRSGQLTKGSRWAIFFLLIVVWVLLAVITAVGGAIGAVGGAALSILVQAVVGTFSTIFSLSVISALYLELRRVKEGIGAVDLASVFD